MSTFTLDHLKVIMQECSGVTEGKTLDGDILDQPLRELGYDSLALLEIASRIQRDYSLDVPDEAIDAMKNPRAILAYVNSCLPAAV
jgi:act minimal PKS acyl carrier protein